MHLGRHPKMALDPRFNMVPHEEGGIYTSHLSSIPTPAGVVLSHALTSIQQTIDSNAVQCKLHHQRHMKIYTMHNMHVLRIRTHVLGCHPYPGREALPTESNANPNTLFGTPYHPRTKSRTNQDALRHAHYPRALQNISLRSKTPLPMTHTNARKTAESTPWESALRFGRPSQNNKLGTCFSRHP